jgi:hypothetical protein
MAAVGPASAVSNQTALSLFPLMLIDALLENGIRLD